MADYRVEHDSMGEVRVPADRALGRPDPACRRELPDLRAAHRAARSCARSALIKAEAARVNAGCARYRR